MEENRGEIIIYQTEDGLTNIEVKMEDETVWLTQQQMADLYKTSRTNVVEHIKHIYEIDSTSDTSIVKYGISQLLKAGLNDSIIKQITGASDTLIRGCIIHEDEDIERIINNKLVSVELYYQF